VRFIFALATLAGIGMIYQVAHVHEFVCP
jgi:hypothetical protein